MVQHDFVHKHIFGFAHFRTIQMVHDVKNGLYNLDTETDYILPIVRRLSSNYYN